MTYKTDAINIAFMDGREKNGWARKEAEVIPQPMRNPERQDNSEYNMKKGYTEKLRYILSLLL